MWRRVRGRLGVTKTLWRIQRCAGEYRRCWEVPRCGGGCRGIPGGPKAFRAYIGILGDTEDSSGCRGVPVVRRMMGGANMCRRCSDVQGGRNVLGVQRCDRGTWGYLGGTGMRRGFEGIPGDVEMYKRVWL